MRIVSILCIVSLILMHNDQLILFNFGTRFETLLILPFCTCCYKLKTLITFYSQFSLSETENICIYCVISVLTILMSDIVLIGKFQANKFFRNFLPFWRVQIEGCLEEQANKLKSLKLFLTSLTRIVL